MVAKPFGSNDRYMSDSGVHKGCRPLAAGVKARNRPHTKQSLMRNARAFRPPAIPEASVVF